MDLSPQDDQKPKPFQMYYVLLSYLESIKYIKSGKSVATQESKR